MSALGDQVQNLRTLQQSYDTLATNIGVPYYTVQNSQASITLEPNTLYRFLSRTNDVTISLQAGPQDTVNEYHFIINIGDTAPTITLPAAVDFGFDITTGGVILPYKTYEISILDNLGIIVEW